MTQKIAFPNPIHRLKSDYTFGIRAFVLINPLICKLEDLKGGNVPVHTSPKKPQEIFGGSKLLNLKT